MIKNGGIHLLLMTGVVATPLFGCAGVPASGDDFEMLLQSTKRAEEEKQVAAFEAEEEKSQLEETNKRIEESNKKFAKEQALAKEAGNDSVAEHKRAQRLEAEKRRREKLARQKQEEAKQRAAEREAERLASEHEAARQKPVAQAQTVSDDTASSSEDTSNESDHTAPRTHLGFVFGQAKFDEVRADLEDETGHLTDVQDDKTELIPESAELQAQSWEFADNLKEGAVTNFLFDDNGTLYMVEIDWPRAGAEFWVAMVRKLDQKYGDKEQAALLHGHRSLYRDGDMAIMIEYEKPDRVALSYMHGPTSTRFASKLEKAQEAQQQAREKSGERTLDDL